MRIGRTARTLTVLAALCALTVTGAQAAPAEPTAPPSDGLGAPAGPSALPPGTDEVVEAPAVEALTTEIPVDERDAKLGDGWESSSDQAWTLSGDPFGLHVLVADATDGYAWRTVATLAQPGVETDRWIGNACLTDSGDRLVVAYAPRSFTNEAELFLQGAWTAVVDLGTGVVRELPVRGSLEYFTPSCGHEEDAVLTVSGGEEIGATRLVRVDAATATIDPPVDVTGQVTSAVLTDAGLVAAIGPEIARIDRHGRVTALAGATSVPFELTTDAAGGVVFLEHDGSTATARRLPPERLTRPTPTKAAPALATGPLTEIGVARAPGGQVLLTGRAKAVRSLPEPVRVAAVSKDAEISTDGEVVVDVLTDRVPVASVDGLVDATSPLSTFEARLTDLDTGRTAVVDALVDGSRATTEADPDAEAGHALSDGRQSPPPSRAASRATDGSAAVQAATAGSDPTGVHDPVDVGRGCSVPRNSVQNQTTQPKPRQVEWAVNQAVKGALTVQRPANWKNLAMPAYTPQGMFPPIALSGGGEVPSQIMLGILAQESNLWQANGYVVPGVTSSPLIGNYYGIENGLDTGDPDRWNPDFLKVDCGYGVAQVTDGMELADTGMPGGRSWNQQRAIALDFAANVAAGLQILQEKWNQTRNAGLTVNDGNPARIENWFFAVWAYNSGFYPEADKFTDKRNGAWGVGWANNPANPSYDPTRPFFHKNPKDATHPQDWPYPEKVLGFAAFPPALLESPGTHVAAYRAAWWPGEGDDADENRALAMPPVMQFCATNFSCNPELGINNGSGIDWGPCWHKDSTGAYDGRCWFNGSTTWKTDCQNTCGRSFIRFPVGWAYQEDGTAYPPVCSTAGLPAGALVVDDVPATAPIARPGCTAGVSAGTFELTFSSGSDPTEFPSKMDLHQLGAGYGSHFWFGHTRDETVRGGSMEFSGTWTLDRPLQQWTRVLVHVPDHGAHTRQAQYFVDPGRGATVARTILQRTMRNGWVSLGVFEVDGVPSVTLSTESPDGYPETHPGGWLVDKSDDVAWENSNEDIAFDAVAFVPLPQKPRDFVVALGDSFSSGEGSGSYYAETDFTSSNTSLRDGCHRSPVTWSRRATLPGATLPVGARADAWDPTLDYHLLACSGALVGHVLRNVDYASGRWGEAFQLERNFLDDNTTLVTVSAGGNDAEFMNTFFTCFGAGECYAKTEDDGTTFDDTTNDNIDAAGDRLETLLGRIRAEAPNAKVLVMGYPPLLSGKCGVMTGWALSAAEITWLNEKAGVLAQRMDDATNDANTSAGATFATFADPEPYFRNRGVCSAVPLINGPVLDTLDPNEVLMSAAQTLHPNADGYIAYGQAMTDTLSAITP